MMTFQFSFSQNKRIDSLKTVIDHKIKGCSSPCSDSTLIKSLNAVTWEFINIGEYDSSFRSASKVLTLYEASPVLQKSYLKGKAWALNNLGLIHSNLTNYPKALEYYQKTMDIAEKVNDQIILSKCHSNIGILYRNQGDFSKALEHYQKSLAINQKSGHKEGEAVNHGNMGIIYKKQGDFTKALDHYFKALEMDGQLNNKGGVARHLGNIALVYDAQNDYGKALDFHFKAFKIHEEIGDANSMSVNLLNIGSIYLVQGKLDEAEEYLLRASKLAYEKGTLLYIMSIEKGLSELYLAKKDFKKAYDHFVKHTETKDKIFTKEKRNDLVRKELNYEFAKKEAVLKIEQEKKQELFQAQIKQQKTQRNALIAGVGLMVALVVVTYRGYRNKRKAHEIISLQKEEVEHQKHIIEEKNKDITDSISYAKRLQQAILPSEKVFSESFKEFFIFYKPKDIVAGDFYWMEKKSGLVFTAVADCTGHGVPGAMVSVVCSNALNRAVKEFGLTDPGLILDKVTDLVIETFEKSGSEVKDGMDISLCVFNPSEGSLKWAGANNALWIISEKRLEEYKPNKQPVGKYVSRVPFTTHNIVLKTNDIIYLFSDGFADQFGGEKGKKFKYSSLKELLLKNSDETLILQKNHLDQSLESWRGPLEQVDDVCIVGIKV